MMTWKAIFMNRILTACLLASSLCVLLSGCGCSSGVSAPPPSDPATQAAIQAEDAAITQQEKQQ